ncbi:glycoside hydrolase family 88 protein [Catenovulum agarivorans]|uniref:glycoside hydrolase family 88 protein n=1 Tax=Catenovulum agarivorans TaxID=1172192 RepID=UPI0002FB5BB2|nr:glycoside hydrolase family 88 protein [Catenovulum agarivorans]
MSALKYQQLPLQLNTIAKLTCLSAALLLPACATDGSAANNNQQQSEQSAINVQTQQLFEPSSQVLAKIEKVANWQIPRLESLDYIQFKRMESLEHKRWVQAVFYTGLKNLAERSHNPTYTQWIGYKGNEWDWQLGPVPYFGDDQLIADTYIWYYMKQLQNPKVLAATKQAFDAIIEANSQVDLEFKPEVDENIVHTCQKRWCWADALFMAPPSWFALSKATGDKKYADYAHREMQATIDYLYDEKYDLLYRDSRFKEIKGEFGEQLFWARGSGWVFAGLARSMEYMDKDDPNRPIYENLFVTMAKKLKSLQKQDGSWAMSLLAHEKSPLPETSGTALFTFGFAWGLNNGLLPENEFLPVVSKGWKLLNSAVHPDGKLGWVQAIGAAPGQVSADDSQLYGVGAYLLAGSEIFDYMQAKEEAAGIKEMSNPPVRAYARHAPERLDDFTWENDKVAFRVYGPAAKGSGISSGVDAWLKKVDYSIIDKWYANHLKGISYHEDRGEGYDPYHTGDSRGVGGTAVWIDGKAYTAEHWLNYQVHETGNKVNKFTLTYQMDTPLGKVTEEKTITLKMHEHLYHVNSKFSLNGKPAKLPIAIGIATHDEKAQVYFNKQTGRISAWEEIDSKGLGTGAIIKPSLVKDIRHLPSEVKDQSHVWLFTSTDTQGNLEYKAGFGWQAAGLFGSKETWNSFLDSTATTYTWK